MTILPKKKIVLLGMMSHMPVAGAVCVVEPLGVVRPVDRASMR